jgi:hypothetical protein
MKDIYVDKALPVLPIINSSQESEYSEVLLLMVFFLLINLSIILVKKRKNI